MTPTASEADLETCRRAYFSRQNGTLWRDIERELGLKDASGKTAMRAVKRWAENVGTATSEMVPNRPAPEMPQEPETPKPSDDVPDIEACKQAYLLSQDGEPWGQVALVTGIGSRKDARRAAERWLKECLDRNRCERCGAVKNHRNRTRMCHPCHAAVHKDETRGLPEETLEKAEREALDGLKRYLASVGKTA